MQSNSGLAVGACTYGPRAVAVRMFAVAARMFVHALRSMAITPHGYLRSPENDLQQMQLRALAQALHHLVLTVPLQLSVRLPAFLLHLRIGCRRLQVFQLQDVAVGHVRIAPLVRQEQEVAVAVVQLDLRLHQVEGVQSQVSLEESLQVVLPQDAVAHRRVFLVAVAMRRISGCQSPANAI